MAKIRSSTFKVVGTLYPRGVCREQGVITLLLLSLLKLILDSVYAVLPDWDIQGQVASFNTSQDMLTTHYGNVSPWAMIVHFMGRFNVFFPVREMFQFSVFAATGLGFTWAFFYAMKFIKTLRGSG